MGDQTIRRGLPRVVGGDPWPPSREPQHALPPGPADPANAIQSASAVKPASTSPGPASPAPVRRGIPRIQAPSDAVEIASATIPAVAGRGLRRGLPRVAGAEPSPPAGSAPLAPGREPVAAPTVSPAPQPAAAREARKIGPLTLRRWGALAGALLIVAAFAVLLVRWLLTLDAVQTFLRDYPGEYELPEGAPVGIPVWLGWQHFFNGFLMLLITRSGLQVRSEKRPSAFWSPRWSPSRKITLNLWFHQSLDILWIGNGITFVALLFVTGQWMKIVPTSWAVFPNAVSAGLQYVSLDWPTDNGWVNYNSLQQLAYFITVFVAAPLAIATGVRMSGSWPQKAQRLNRLYPVEWARALHFPVMLYFVAFIFVHVVLVLATGALRNFNHMYGNQDAVNWTGFVIFVASLFVLAAGWIAARPLVLAPIAKLFGKVSSR